MARSPSVANRTYLTPAEVAEMLLVSPITVRQWAQRGWLNAEVTAGGHRRFLKSEVERFARERGLALHAPPSDEKRVLIVDDDQHFRGYLVELLSGPPANMVVESATDGFEAGHKVTEFKPDFILLDLMMPGMNGFDVCRRLKENPNTRPIQIIAITGFGNKKNIERILAAGAQVCLTKPLDEPALWNALGIETGSRRGTRKQK